MRVKVKLFAMLREKSGVSSVEFTLDPGSTVAAAMDWLRDVFPAIGSMLARSAVAVNREYAARNTVLNDGDELAVIPPVSGG